MQNNIYILDRFEGNWAILINWNTNKTYVAAIQELNTRDAKEGDLFVLEDGIFKPKEKDEERKEKMKLLFKSLKKD